jgi:hypothetical protein
MYSVLEYLLKFQPEKPFLKDADSKNTMSEKFLARMTLAGVKRSAHIVILLIWLLLPHSCLYLFCWSEDPGPIGKYWAARGHCLWPLFVFVFENATPSSIEQSTLEVFTNNSFFRTGYKFSCATICKIA